MLHTDSFEAFSSAVAEIIKDNGSAVQSNGDRDTSTYASRRLIVKSKGERLNLEEYGARTIIEGPSGYYVMQLRRSRRQKHVSSSCSAILRWNYVEPDGYDCVGEISVSEEIEAQEPETAALSGSSASSYNSWGVK